MGLHSSLALPLPAVYITIRIDMEGHKDVLGMYGNCIRIQTRAEPQKIGSAPSN